MRPFLLAKVRGGFASGGITQTVSTTIDASIGCDGNPVMLNPGDAIYVHVFLGAHAQRGAILDARNTIRVDLAAGTPDQVRRQVFDNLARSVAPEPAIWALMLGGFGMVGGAVRLWRAPEKIGCRA